MENAEHDFLGIASHNAAHFRLREHGNSHRGIHNAISRLNPELLKNMMASGAGNKISQPPVLNLTSRSSAVMSSSASAPMTIFYDSAVLVIDVSQDKAMSILKLAESAAESQIPAMFGQDELEKLSGELLPIARKKSMQRFLAKRKERLIASTPYGDATHVVNHSFAAKYVDI